MAADNWTFWLNMTNFALGIITLLALVIVFGAVGWDLLVRKAQSAREHGNLDLSTLDGELRAMLNRIAQLVRARLGLDHGRRWRKDRSRRVPGLRPEIWEVNYGVPVSKRRSSTILSCCARAEADPRRAWRDTGRPLCLSAIRAVRIGCEETAYDRIVVRIWRKSACNIAESHRSRNWCLSVIRSFQVARATPTVIAIPTCCWHTRTPRLRRRIFFTPQTISGWMPKNPDCATSAWTDFSPM